MDNMRLINRYIDLIRKWYRSYGWYAGSIGQEMYFRTMEIEEIYKMFFGNELHHETWNEKNGIRVTVFIGNQKECEFMV